MSGSIQYVQITQEKFDREFDRESEALNEVENILKKIQKIGSDCQKVEGRQEEQFKICEKIEKNQEEAEKSIQNIKKSNKKKREGIDEMKRENSAYNEKLHKKIKYLNKEMEPLLRGSSKSRCFPLLNCCGIINIFKKIFKERII